MAGSHITGPAETSIFFCLMKNLLLYRSAWPESGRAAMIVKCAATIRAVLDIEPCHRNKNLIAATALPFPASLLKLFVTNVEAMQRFVYSRRKTGFLEGKKKIFNVGLN